ncbi:hypothetical protein ACWGCW_01040 [Streptomyces sp. NPDC054933]
MDSTDSTETSNSKRAPRKSPPPVEQAAPEPEQATVDPPEPKPSGPAPEWLRYTGQTATVFLDLGGEIEPGQVVRPRDADLVGLLLDRVDFEAAAAPSDAADGTAN